MDKIWVRYDHFKAQEQAWGKAGAYISRHAPCKEEEMTEEQKMAAKKASRKRDQAFSERLHALSKTGKLPVNREQRHQSSGAETERASVTQKGIPMSVAPRFGYTPYARLTELQQPSMSHIGPGAYNNGQETDSIRQRTRVTSNNSAAFAMTTPRFGKKHRVETNDGGARKRREKEARMKRAREQAMFYGDVHHKDDVELRATDFPPLGSVTAR